MNTLEHFRPIVNTFKTICINEKILLWFLNYNLFYDLIIVVIEEFAFYLLNIHRHIAYNVVHVIEL